MNLDDIDTISLNSISSNSNESDKIDNTNKKIAWVIKRRKRDMGLHVNISKSPKICDVLKYLTFLNKK
jgi:hypothetical protein